MAKKIVAKRFPIGLSKEKKEKIVNTLNAEFDGKIECRIELGKVFIMEYENLDDSDLFSIGSYVGANTIVK